MTFEKKTLFDNADLCYWRTQKQRMSVPITQAMAAHIQECHAEIDRLTELKDSACRIIDKMNAERINSPIDVSAWFRRDHLHNATAGVFEMRHSNGSTSIQALTSCGQWVLISALKSGDHIEEFRRLILPRAKAPKLYKIGNAEYSLSEIMLNGELVQAIKASE